MKDRERRASKRYKLKENKKFPYKRKRKYSKKERRFEKATVIGFLFGISIGILCFLVAIFILFSEPLVGQNINDFFVSRAFKLVANSWEETDVVSSLSYLCSLKTTEFEKMNCVYTFITDNMEVGFHDRKTNKLRQVDEIFSQPSVCRDTSVLFRSVMNRMNISNDLVHEPGHIYNRVFLTDYTCDLDLINEVWECEKNEK